MARYLDVAVNVPLFQTFTYEEPQEMPFENQDPFGFRLEVRFGNRKLNGFVVGVHETLPKNCPVAPEKIRKATRYIDKEPLLTKELYSLALWMSRYYLSPIGECIFAMIPSGKRETEYSFLSFLGDEKSFEKKTLSEEQARAVDGIFSLRENPFHYLYGMTGSGKTEVFLSSAEKVLEQKKGVIYLVPEISLTPQVTEAVVRRFGNMAAVLHSALTPSQRLGEWKRILHKEARIVVGARSAVFAPIPDLGLLIIDEEHDSSYKAGSAPRYHARQVAMFRASTLHIPLVMGSATPSLEAWHLMEEKKITKHTLSARIAGGAPPELKCVNLTCQAMGDNCLSPPLIQEIEETLKRKRQVILFLNRRGFTHFFRCNTCGFEQKCKNCSVSLTYHRAENRLRCHYCGYSIQPPQQCPSCGSLDVGYFGFGTEYIESEVKARFPHAKVVRIDTDSTKSKNELQQKLESFKNGEYDILLGTQMVAKGLNFPALQLVGIVLADTALHLPDFRAEERTFALITQVAGRAGRFFPDGKVLVQTYNPYSPPIEMAVNGNLESFYKEELTQREILNFPPFSRLLRLVFRSSVENAAQTAAFGAKKILESFKQSEIDILGPAECPLEKVGAAWRMQILLRGKRIEVLQKIASNLILGYTPPQNVYIEVDVDPQNLL